MADDIIVPQVEPQAAQPSAPAIPADVAQMMEMSLSIGKPTANPYQQPTQVDIPPTTINNEIPETPVTPDQTTTPIVQDVFQPFKEKFGYQSAEDAIKEIEELRLLKANPPASTEYKYENDESKKLAAAISKGDRKEVYNILAKQEKIESLISTEVNKDNAAEIIKLGMQLKNSELTPQEVEFLYKQEYIAPKEPVQKATEDEDEFAERHNEWKEKVEMIEMKRVVAAKMAKPELESHKSKLVLPEIDTEVDEGYDQYLKMLEDRPRLQAELSQEYKTLTPKSIEARVKFVDEANKIDFEFQYEPDVESFNQTVELVSDGEKLQKRFLNQEGKPDRKGFLEALHFGLNKEKIILEAIKQSKNATIKASLPDNSSGGLQRQFPQRQELSEVDKLMQASLSVR